MERRLAAVLAADMAGYSRLMEADEQGTLARLRTHRIELIDPAVAKNHGRIIKTTGDGMLVEFGSVADAVSCAVEVQERMRRRNSDVPAESRIEFRIGINLGDIIFEEDDIFGDGVNVASRVESIADVGGIAVTSAVRDQLGDRMDDVTFDDLGEKTLKNLSRPVHVYRVVLPDAPKTGKGAHSAAASPAAAPDGAKPSIAVLPFANMSGDPEQDFFVDGLTEDIITELSRRHELFVISRTSSFVYRGRAVNLKEVAKDLGARYLAEGSVRKAGDRVRVTVQLIDTATDSHIWAEKYDRKLEDVFAIQDEVTSSIVATLPGRLEAARHEQAKRKPTENLAAYECVLVGKVHHHMSKRDANAKALSLLDRAIALDPDYAHAYAWKACVIGQAWSYGWVEDPDAAWATATGAAQRALALDDSDADVHRLLAAISVLTNDLEKAQYHQERALALNPNYDLVVVQQGELLTWLGRPDEGVEWIQKAMRLNPHHPARFWSHLGKAYFAARRYGEAVAAFLRLSSLDNGQTAFLAAAYARMGDATAATAHAARLRDAEPPFDAAAFLATMHYGNDEDLKHLREGMAKAGIPTP